MHHFEMRRVLFTILVLVLPLHAQMRTLIPKTVSHGIYVSPLLSLSQFGPNDKFGMSPGVQIGWTLNKTLTIGWKASQLWYPVKAGWIKEEAARYLNISSTGLFVSYTLHPDALVHAEFFGLVGGGLTGYRIQKLGDFDNLEDDFFLFEPGIDVETNVTQFMRIGLGISYLIFQGAELQNMNNADFSGINFFAMMKIGIFK